MKHSARGPASISHLLPPPKEKLTPRASYGAASNKSIYPEYDRLSQPGLAGTLQA